MSATGPRIPVAATAVTVLFALLLGFFGNDAVKVWLDRPENSQATDLDTGDLDQRTDRLGAPDGQEAGQPATGTGPQVMSPPAAPVADDPEFLAIRERLAADLVRREERARLASDSPLTPAVTATADLAGRGREPPPSAPVTQDGPPGAEPSQVTTAPEGADPAPTHLLARGSFIPAVLRTLVNSDLPGLVQAQVTEPVFDSVTGAHMLIPAGSSIVGTYGSDAAPGQRRMFITWTDLRMPDGTPLGLREFPAVGDDGATGIRGRRSTNVLAALGAAVLFDLAGNATGIIFGDGPATRSDPASILGMATGNATSRVAQEYLGRLLARGPRFRVRPGTLMNVVVEQDMLLPAIGGA